MHVFDRWLYPTWSSSQTWVTGHWRKGRLVRVLYHCFPGVAQMIREILSCLLMMWPNQRWKCWEGLYSFDLSSDTKDIFITTYNVAEKKICNGPLGVELVGELALHIKPQVQLVLVFCPAIDGKGVNLWLVTGFHSYFLSCFGRKWS